MLLLFFFFLSFSLSLFPSEFSLSLAMIAGIREAFGEEVCECECGDGASVPAEERERWTFLCEVSRVGRPPHPRCAHSLLQVGSALLMPLSFSYILSPSFSF
jgi:hypothetical protein